MTHDAGSYSNYAAGGGGGNDWELVSLTASTYAAAPGPVLPLLLDAHKKTEPPPAAVPAIFMSQHFNLAAAEAHTSILNGCKEEEGATDNLHIPCLENCVREQDGSGMTCRSDFHKDLSTTLGLDDGNLLSDAGNAPPLQGGGGVPACLAREERRATMLCSSAPPGFDATQPHAAGSDHIRSTSVHHHVSAAATDAATDGTIDFASSLPVHSVHVAARSGSGIACVVPKKGISPRIPCEAQAWWNNTFKFLSNNSKESLTFRFIFVAATIVGIAVLGQRSKVQLRLEFNVDSEEYMRWDFWQGWVSDSVDYQLGLPETVKTTQEGAQSHGIVAAVFDG